MRQSSCEKGRLQKYWGYSRSIPGQLHTLGSGNAWSSAGCLAIFVPSPKMASRAVAWVAPPQLHYQGQQPSCTVPWFSPAPFWEWLLRNSFLGQVLLNLRQCRTARSRGKGGSRDQPKCLFLIILSVSVLLKSLQCVSGLVWGRPTGLFGLTNCLRTKMVMSAPGQQWGQQPVSLGCGLIV